MMLFQCERCQEETNEWVCQNCKMQAHHELTRETRIHPQRHRAVRWTSCPECLARAKKEVEASGEAADA